MTTNTIEEVPRKVRDHRRWKNPNYRHGWRGTPTYNSWQNMKAQSNVSKYWLKFENFLNDMGPKPSGKNVTLRRINPKWPHDKFNCEWSTGTRRPPPRKAAIYEHDGVVMTLAQWSVTLGISKNAVYKRFRRNGTPHESG